MALVSFVCIFLLHLLVFIILKPLGSFFDKIGNCILSVFSLFNKNKKTIFRFLSFNTIVIFVVRTMLLILENVGFHGFIIGDNPVRCNWKTVFCLFVPVLITEIIYHFRNVLLEKLAIIGSVVLFLIGLLYVILEPVNCGISWDDEVHYERSAVLSHIIDHNNSFADIELVELYEDSIGNHNVYMNEEIIKKQTIISDIESHHLTWDSSDYRLIYVFIVYLPIVIGLVFSRGLELPFAASIPITVAGIS